MPQPQLLLRIFPQFIFNIVNSLPDISAWTEAMNTSKVTTAAAAVSKADWIAAVSAVVQVVTEVTEMLHEVWTTVEAGL